MARDKEPFRTRFTLSVTRLGRTYFTTTFGTLQIALSQVERLTAAHTVHHHFQPVLRHVGGELWDIGYDFVELGFSLGVFDDILTMQASKTEIDISQSAVVFRSRLIHVRNALDEGRDGAVSGRSPLFLIRVSTFRYLGQGADLVNVPRGGTCLCGDGDDGIAFRHRLQYLGRSNPICIGIRSSVR